MIGKTLIAAAAVAASFAVALPAQEAKAGVDVDIGIGVAPYYAGGYAGGGYDHGGYDDGYDDNGYDGYDGDYGYGHGYGHGYRPYHRFISCSTGGNIVADAGFHRVRAVDCDPPNYRYTAKRNGHKYLVRVSGRGNIIDVRRIH